MAANRKTSSETSEISGRTEHLSGLALPTALTAETVEAICAQWRDVQLGDVSHMVLHAADLESITTPGLQLLISLKKTLANHHADVAFEGLRADVASIFRDAGLEALLHTPS